jgi:hypothetical protein
MNRGIAAMRGFGLTSVSWIFWIAVVASGSGGACSSKGLVGGTGGAGGDATGETGGRGFGGGGDTGGSPVGRGGGGDAGAGFLGDTGGVAGSGDAGTGTGGAGGAVCPPPLSSFGCAATYDQQVANGVCLSSGRITYGPCGSGWDWHCTSIWSDDCLYDANKNLMGAKHCDDAPNLICSRCNLSATCPYCYQSSGYMTDGGPACSTGALGD